MQDGKSSLASAMTADREAELGMPADREAELGLEWLAEVWAEYELSATPSPSWSSPSVDAIDARARCPDHATANVERPMTAPRAPLRTRRLA